MGASYGFFVYNKGADKYGSRASIDTPGGQQPANNEFVLHRVLVQSDNNAANPPGAIQAGIYRTNNLALADCGTSDGEFHKFVERRVQGGTYHCARYSAPNAGADVAYSLYRTPTDGQWRVDTNGDNILGTYPVNFLKGRAGMGSEISSAGNGPSSYVDETFCAAKNWNVFNSPSEGQAVLVNSNSDVGLVNNDSGWSFGNFPCAINIGH